MKIFSLIVLLSFMYIHQASSSCEQVFNSRITQLRKNIPQNILKQSISTRQLTLKDGLSYIEALINSDSIIKEYSHNFSSDYLKHSKLDKFRFAHPLKAIQRLYKKVLKKEYIISKNINSETDFLKAIKNIYSDYLDKELFKMTISNTMRNLPTAYNTQYSIQSVKLLRFYKVLKKETKLDIDSFIFDDSSLILNLDKKGKFRDILTYIRSQAIRRLKLSQDELIKLRGYNEKEISLYIQKKYSTHFAIKWSLSLLNNFALARYAYIYAPFWSSFLIISPYLFIVKDDVITHAKEYGNKDFTAQDLKDLRLIYSDNIYLKLEEIENEMDLENFKGDKAEIELLESLYK